MTLKLSQLNEPTHCNQATLTLSGTDEVWKTLREFTKTRNWSTDDVTRVNQYTDGYKARIEQVLASDGLASMETGICITVGKTTENGGACHTAKASLSGTEIAADGHNLIYFTPAEWSDTAIHPDRGTKQKEREIGLVVGPGPGIPDTLREGEKLTAEWY